MIYSEVLRNLSLGLSKLGIAPRKIQLAQIGPYYHAVAFDEESAGIIGESSTCGFSRDSEVAVGKALVEWVERQAGREAAANGIEVCQTERSDGLAAYPVKLESYAHRAREGALNEAIERYVWASWWDHPETGYRESSISDLIGSGTSAEVILEACGSLGCEKLMAIEPLHNFSGKQVLILIAFTKSGGVFSGGACGDIEDTEVTVDRAFAELYRHLLAYQKFVNGNPHSNSFYERRLLYFASGKGFRDVETRLQKKGSRVVELPTLKFDQEVTSQFSSLVYVHRCLFDNQPPFVGGAMERFCL